MALSRKTEAYIGFLKISEKAYAEQVRYYEDAKGLLYQLPIEEKIELQILYLNALFELGAHDKFLNKVDLVISDLFELPGGSTRDNQNLKSLLFKKARALYKLFRTEEAQILAEQTVRMYQDSEEHKHLLNKIYKRQIEHKTRNFKALSIGLYLFAAFCIGVCLFIIDPFFSQHKAIGQIVWQSVFAIATISLISNELYIIFKSKKKLQDILNT